ncbi:MAG TPA: aspartyl protease family protein [Candidatus Rubrimentiphilum sp.]|nr:aspartyl protease family protein [Candidatus Rubrimentiphilum sp.]
MIFAAAMSLFSVLAHMRQVNGDVYAAHIASTAAVTVNGQAATQQTDTQGLRFLLRQCSGAVCPGTYFDGHHLYGVTINGTALPRSQFFDADMRALRVIGELNFLAPAFSQEGGRILDGGTVTFGNCVCRRIYVSDPFANASEVFVDPHTWLIAGAHSSGGSVFTMRDYRRVGAYRLPFRIDRDGLPLEQYTTRSIVATPLQAPQGLSVQLGSSPDRVPLDPASTTPDASCTLRGITVRCMFDTGNSGMSMSLELAEQLNLNPIGVFNVSGLGNYATEVVRTGPLQIGSVRFGDAEYVVLSDIHRYGYDLVLGADVLAAAPVTIDYAQHAIVFGSAAPPNAPAVDLSFENFVPVVDVLLGGQPARLAVDTGDQSVVNLSDDFYGHHSSLFVPTHTENVSGVGGASVELMGEIPSVTVGPITTGPQPIGTTRTLRGTANGHLGAGFLSNFIVLLDYLHQRMELRPKHA